MEDAINTLSGQLLPDFPNIKVLVKDGKIKFEVEEIEEETSEETEDKPSQLEGTITTRKPPIEYPPLEPKVKTKKALPIPLSNLSDTEIMNLQIRLGEILREFEVTKLTLHIYTEKEFEFRVVFENRELAEKTLGRIINFIKSSFIKRFSETGKIVNFKVGLTFKEPVPEDSLKAKLGEFYPKERQSSLDKLIG